MCLIGAPAFIRDRGHKDQLQVNGNLLNGTVTTYQVRYAIICTHWLTQTRRLATLPFINFKLCTHIVYFLLHHLYIVYVLFVSDTNLDCNIVHTPNVRYHNTVTSGN